MPARIKLECAEGPEGGVRIDVLTRRPLTESSGYTSLPDPRGHLEERGFGFGVIGGPGGVEPNWRYIEVSAVVDFDEFAQHNHRRWLDLSDGSHERRCMERIVAQDTVRVAWVREGVEIDLAIPESTRTACAEALAATRGVGSDEWREELAEFEWRRSPSWRPGVPRPRRHRRRTAGPPERPVSFFARRSGALPRDGKPTVAGVELPRGRRQPSPAAAYWASDAVVDDAVELASRFAAAFADTGLWPLLWSWPEDPAAYFHGHGDADAIAAANAEELMRAAWESWPPNPEATAPFGHAFPGLAAAGAPPTGSSDPFGILARDVRAPSGPGRRLLLVPCNRPADVLTVLGLVTTRFEVAEVSAMMRSWEERFDAVPAEVEHPALVTLAVGSPPSGLEQARLLAAELMAAAPTGESGSPGALEELAALVSDGAQPPYRTELHPSPNVWKLGLGE